jgi:putative two-component system response regulator
MQESIVPMAGAKRVLVVDDDEFSRRALQRVLDTCGYEVEVAQDGLECLTKLQLEIDLVLLDASMPGMDGYEVTDRIRQDPMFQDLPIIMVTGLDGRQDRLRAVEVGVNDFLSKPFDATELMLRSKWLLRMKESMDALKEHQAELETTVEQRTAALRRALEKTAEAQRLTQAAHLDTIRRLVLAAEYKDEDTAAHIERIGRYTELIATHLGLAPRQIEVIRNASPLHDVGKIGIPDAILLKPGKLTEAEWAVMREHTTMGARILQSSPSEVLQVGAKIAQSHHERWDGGGYPNALEGESIPLEGRICAVSDFFDALTTDRSYRDAVANQAVFEMMISERGKHFDPTILDLFLDHRDEVEEIQACCGEQAALGVTDDSQR